MSNKPRVFIGSSVEGLQYAQAIQSNLDHSAISILWSQNVFTLSNNTIDDLIKQTKSVDFAILVLTPDDKIEIRKENFSTVRDNLLFELGLFIGAISKERVFYVVPRIGYEIHLPTDLLGITKGTFELTEDESELQAVLGPFCNQVKIIIKKLGRISDTNNLTSASKKKQII